MHSLQSPPPPPPHQSSPFPLLREEFFSHYTGAESQPLTVRVSVNAPTVGSRRKWYSNRRMKMFVAQWLLTMNLISNTRLLRLQEQDKTRADIGIFWPTHTPPLPPKKARWGILHIQIQAEGFNLYFRNYSLFKTHMLNGPKFKY